MCPIMVAMWADRKRKALEYCFGEEASGLPTTKWRPFFLRSYNNRTMNMVESFEDSLIEEGDFTRALTFQSAVYGRVRRRYGDEHRRTIDAAERLAIALDKVDRRQEAIEIERTVLHARTRPLGADHKHTILALKGLSGMLKTQGQLDEAEDLYRKLTDIEARVVGTNNTALIHALCSLVDVLDDQGKLVEAQETALPAVQLSTCDKDRMDASQWLGMMHRRLRDFDSAIAILRGVVAYRTRELGVADKATISSLIQLSTAFYLRGEAGDLTEARLLAEQSRDIAIAHWGQEDDWAALAVNLLRGISSKEVD